MLQFSKKVEVAVANRSGAMESRDHIQKRSDIGNHMKLRQYERTK